MSDQRNEYFPDATPEDFQSLGFEAMIASYPEILRAGMPDPTDDAAPENEAHRYGY